MLIITILHWVITHQCPCHGHEHKPYQLFKIANQQQCDNYLIGEDTRVQMKAILRLPDLTQTEHVPLPISRPPTARVRRGQETDWQWVSKGADSRNSLAQSPCLVRCAYRPSRPRWWPMIGDVRPDPWMKRPELASLLTLHLTATLS